MSNRTLTDAICVSMKIGKVGQIHAVVAAEMRRIIGDADMKSKLLTTEGKETQMKAMICTQCGGAIDPVRMVCPYCGTHYHNGHNNMIKIIDRGHAELLKCKVMIDDVMVHHLSDDSLGAMIKHDMANKFADALAPYITVRSERDMTTGMMALTGSLRVLPESYRF